MTNNIEVWLHIILIVLVLLFALLYSLMILLDSKSLSISKVFAVIIMIAAIYLGTNRNMYLPFLGYTALPPSLFDKEVTPSGATETLNIKLDNVPNDTKIIYWAATGSKDKDVVKSNPTEAYGDYGNAGVTTVKDNKAVLYFHCPDRYNVGLFQKTLNKHVHYRLVRPNNPIISPVYTQNVTC